MRWSLTGYIICFILGMVIPSIIALDAMSDAATAKRAAEFCRASLHTSVIGDHAETGTNR